MPKRKPPIVLGIICVLCFDIFSQQSQATVLAIRPDPKREMHKQGRATRRAVLPPDTDLVIKDSAAAFSELELNDGCVVRFQTSLKAVNITVVKLILHGKSTIDLTPRVSIPPTPDTQPGKLQAHNDPPTQRGEDGLTGAKGTDGSNGVELNLSIQKLDAADGSLWIKTDGTPGGSGGQGGSGGKGAGPRTSGTSCKDGGDGGNGGTGGTGGNGGNTAKVKLKIGPNTISPTQANGVAPSSRPQSANVAGTIVIQGAPGAGGPGGGGGSRGDAGEGRKCPFPATDAKQGRDGRPGASGSAGRNGIFIP